MNQTMLKTVMSRPNVNIDLTFAFRDGLPGTQGRHIQVPAAKNTARDISRPTRAQYPKWDIAMTTATTMLRRVAQISTVLSSTNLICRRNSAWCWIESPPQKKLEAMASVIVNNRESS